MLLLYGSRLCYDRRDHQENLVEILHFVAFMRFIYSVFFGQYTPGMLYEAKRVWHVFMLH